jgi:hypothetical protein
MVKTLYSILHRSLDLTVFIHFLPNITIKTQRDFPFVHIATKGYPLSFMLFATSVVFNEVAG